MEMRYYNRLGYWTMCVLVAGLFLAAAAPALYAQSVEMPDVRAITKAHLQEARWRLGLSAKQVVLITPIVRQSEEKRAVILDEHGVRPGARVSLSTLMSMRPQMQAIRQETRSKVAPFLTPAQLVVWDDISDEIRLKIRKSLVGF